MSWHTSPFDSIESPKPVSPMFRNPLTSIERSIPLPARAAFEPLTIEVARSSLSMGARNVPVIVFVGWHLPSTATLLGFFFARWTDSCSSVEPPPWQPHSDGGVLPQRWTTGRAGRRAGTEGAGASAPSASIRLTAALPAVRWRPITIEGVS